MEPTHALRMARELLTEHGLRDWTVRLDRAKTRAGICRYRERVIGLSGPMTRLHSEAEVRDTVLHEIAHALVGPQHGHDQVWRATARSIGCSGQRCVPADAPRPEGPWRGVCPAGHEVTRHRRPTRVHSCSRCSRGFSPAHLIGWTYAGRRAEMHPSYVAELAELRRRYGQRVRVGPGEQGVTDRGGPGPGPQGLPTGPDGREGAQEGGRDGRWPDPDDHSGSTVRRLGSGRPLDLGVAARILAPGRWHGVVGTVEGLGRTRVQVRVEAGVLAVPSDLLEVV